MILQKFNSEFTLQIYNTSVQTVKSSLTEFGEGLQIEEGPDGLKISIATGDPTLIFDICSQFGRIKAVKVDEIK